MKRVFKFTGFVAGLGAAIWLMRDRLISIALPREPEPPTFRVGPAGEGDDLTEIKGIGDVFAARLNSAGITTFEDLAGADPETLASQIDTQATRIQEWVEQARARTS